MPVLTAPHPTRPFPSTRRLKEARRCEHRWDRPNNLRGAGGTRKNEDGVSNDDAKGDGADDVRVLGQFAKEQKPSREKRGSI
jgi:hypothetical protein